MDLYKNCYKRLKNGACSDSGLLCETVENCDFKKLPIETIKAIAGLDKDDYVEGIKYDKDKPRMGEMIQDFGDELFKVVKVWEFGANKYSKSNWKKVDNGFDRYTNAMIRHFIQEQTTDGYDEETGYPHAYHVAWNALARLHFLEKEISIS